MKKITKFFSFMLAVALLVLLPDAGSLTASAAGTTYVVGYNTGSSQWRWQQDLTAFDITQPDSDLYYLKDHLRDGDTVIVDGGSSNDSLVLELPVRVGNLTVMNTSTAVAVSATSIDTFYAQLGAHVGVSGSIQNAYVYNDCHVTFNSPVQNLEIIAPGNYYNVITSTSTVAHAKAHNGTHTFYEVYNVAEGKFESETAVLRTDPMFYSATPAAGTSETNTNAAASGASGNAASNSAGGTVSDEYDDVPKTGAFDPTLLLLSAAAVCFAGSRKLHD